MTHNDVLKNYSIESRNLDIKIYPDPVLTKVAKDVETFDEELQNLAIQMLDTMYNAPGIGLAAPQIGKSIRMIVLDTDFKFEVKTDSEGNDQRVITEINPQVFINPTYTSESEKIKYQEGCLSLPKIFEDVSRYKEIKLNYFDLDGKKRELQADGLLSICIQHEIDHLDGIVFIDHLSSLKKGFIKKKLLKAKKKAV